MGIKGSTLVKCPICKGPVKHICATDECNQEFCFQCLRMWARNPNSCRNCKKIYGKVIGDIKINNNIKNFNIPNEVIYKKKPLLELLENFKERQAMIFMEGTDRIARGFHLMEEIGTIRLELGQRSMPKNYSIIEDKKQLKIKSSSLKKNCQQRILNLEKIEEIIIKRFESDLNDLSLCNIGMENIALIIGEILKKIGLQFRVCTQNGNLDDPAQALNQLIESFKYGTKAIRVNSHATLLTLEAGSHPLKLKLKRIKARSENIQNIYKKSIKILNPKLHILNKCYRYNLKYRSRLEHIRNYIINLKTTSEILFQHTSKLEYTAQKFLSYYKATNEEFVDSEKMVALIN